MVRGVAATGIVGLVSLVILSGCAATNKDRISAAEGANRDLNSHMERLRNENEALKKDREQLNQRFLAANKAADDLRNQLAQRPEPVLEEAAPGWTAVPGGAMIAIDDNVLFSPGKAVLRDQARKTLDAVANTINGEYASKDILVFGHTDDRPIKKSGWDDNWQLSSERSLAVVRYLRERSISADRLVAAGCGEHRPRAENNSETNRARNRRVEIFAIDPQSQTGRR